MLFEVRRALSEFLGAEPARRTLLEPIEGGRGASALYRFESGGRAYVLRDLGVGRSEDRRRREVALTLAAGRAGAGPAVRFVTDDGSAIVYDYTPGRTLRLDDLRQGLVLERLAERLSRLHRSDAEIPAAASPFADFQRFRRWILGAQRPWPRAMVEATDYLRRLERELPPATLRPCHLDLHARNLILTPALEPMLIDWGNGGASDPAFDFATLIVFLDLGLDQRRTLLEVYRENLGQTPDLARIEQLAPVRPLVVAASCLAMTPPQVSSDEVEKAFEEEAEPYPVLFCRPRAERPVWPVWRWGVAALKTGLAYIR